MTLPSFIRLGAGNARDVRTLYERYPYPSTSGTTLIDDVANWFYSLFGDDSLQGRRVLDVGCGTGHRLLGAARTYPSAHFLGIDVSAASIEAATMLKQKNGLKNVELRREDLLTFGARDTFDVIVAAGVVHHLESPRRGIEALGSMLADEGVLVVWLYHLLGEQQRLLDRELVLTMWDRAGGFAQGLELVKGLGLGLETNRYGSSAQPSGGVSQTTIDVDAYLNPIVNAYRFEDGIELFRGCTALDWVAVNNVTLPNASKLVDLGEVEQGSLRYFSQTVDELFAATSLRQRFRQLSSSEKLRVLEILLKPTGFTIVAGRGDSYKRLGARTRSNVIALRHENSSGQ
jgi:SAM-dependent methyltransferase